VYEEAQTRERFKTWDMLKFIKSSSDLLWVCMGNFNEVYINRNMWGYRKEATLKWRGSERWWMYAVSMV
jgi:hypothetical protein